MQIEKPLNKFLELNRLHSNDSHSDVFLTNAKTSLRSPVATIQKQRVKLPVVSTPQQRNWSPRKVERNSGMYSSLLDLNEDMFPTPISASLSTPNLDATPNMRSRTVRFDKNLVKPPLVEKDTEQCPVPASPKSVMAFDLNSPATPGKKPVSGIPKSSAKNSKTSPRLAGKEMDYKGWDFGKKKNFTPPKPTKSNQKAAVTLQRYIRGYMQRLHFKIRMLEHRLATKDQRTAAAIAKVNDRMEQRKEACLHRMQKEHQRELSKVTREEECAKEAQEVIAYLRHENKKLRESNQKIHDSIKALKQHNARLENANDMSADSFCALNGHTKQIEETYKKLQDVIPKYEESVKALQDAVRMRQQYCLSEHRIKLLYQQCIGNVVQVMEEQCTKMDLVDEVIQMCLALESAENSLPIPPKLPDTIGLEGEDKGDDDSIDEYTVATLDE